MTTCLLKLIIPAYIYAIQYIVITVKICYHKMDLYYHYFCNDFISRLFHNYLEKSQLSADNCVSDEAWIV